MEAVQQETPAQGIEAAWKKYQVTEKYGLEFGKALCRYRDEHKSKGGNGSKGKGLGQLLDELSIPKSTAYWWINRYEISIGVKEPKPEKERDWYAFSKVAEVRDDEPYCTCGLCGKMVHILGGRYGSHINPENEHCVASGKSVGERADGYKYLLAEKRSRSRNVVEFSPAENAFEKTVAEAVAEIDVPTEVSEAPEYEPPTRREVEAADGGMSLTSALRQMFKCIPSSIKLVRLAASTFNSGVPSSSGRYDIELNGLTPAQLKRVHEALVEAKAATA